MSEMSLDDLQHLLWEFARHRIVTVAARTGVLTRLAECAATPSDVARELALDGAATDKLMRALTAIGLLTADGEMYRVVDSLAPLLRSGPNEITPFIEHSHMLYDAWGESLEPWLRGEPWGTRARDPEQTRRFGAAMRAVGSQIAARVARHLEVGDARRMLDLGGGFGQYSAALCAPNDGLRATVLDTPEVVRLARDELDPDLEGRIDFVGGDYHATELGGGFDLVLLANILHQETAPRAAALIRRAVDELALGGRLAVVDFQIDDAQRQHPFGTLFAINMRSFGDTHSEPAIRSWMEEAGLADITRTDIDPDRWLILGRRAGAPSISGELR